MFVVKVLIMKRFEKQSMDRWPSYNGRLYLYKCAKKKRQVSDTRLDVALFNCVFIQKADYFK